MAEQAQVAANDVAVGHATLERQRCVDARQHRAHHLEHVPDQLMCPSNANPATGVGSQLSCLTINARILNLPVMRYFRYLLKRTHRVPRPTDDPVENSNKINNLAHSGCSQLTDSGGVLAA